MFLDDAAELLLFPPVDEGVGNAADSLVGNVVFRVPLLEHPAGVDQENFPLALLRLGIC